MSTFFKIEAHPPKTLKWWWTRRNVIDFDPPYQRKGKLWSDQDKAFLIDSILNGFDIPKLYVADYQYGPSELNDKKLPYAIIDGKQRMEAIFDFFDNKLRLDQKFKWRNAPNASMGGLGLRDLQNLYPSAAEEFENASLTIMSVYTNNDALINELFVRLNRSKPLTGAEVRNAMPGTIPSIIREIAKHEVFAEIIRFSTTRAGDANAAAKVLLFEYVQSLTSTKKKDLDSFARGDAIDGAINANLELAARRTIDTLDEMRDVFLPADPLLANAGIFPVYYWFVRSIDPFYHSDIRTFLLIFERKRTENRDLQRENPNSTRLNETLTRYDTLNRSTNDAGSHRGRVKILIDFFDDFLNDWHSLEEREKAKLLRYTPSF